MRILTMTGMIVLGCSLGALACDAEPMESAASEARSAETVAQKSSRSLRSKTEFFAPAPDAAAIAQVRELFKARDHSDAHKLRDLIETPHAVWFTGGTPCEVKAAVQKTMADASCEHKVPVLVAYNLPYRDCAQYSAGGAADTAAYEAWVDGFAQGIGNVKAVVILEPDSLGIIPYNTTINGSADWCKPTVTDS